MHEWHVTLTQRGGTGTRFNHTPYVRHLAAIVTALDARDAARRAQRVHQGWTAVLVERQPAACPMCGGGGGYHDVCDAHVAERGA